MTQQYQHIEQRIGLAILKMTPRMLQLWNAHERAMGRLPTPEEFIQKWQDAPPAKHPLLMPPFVKVK